MLDGIVNNIKRQTMCGQAEEGEEEERKVLKQNKNVQGPYSPHLELI